MFDLSKSTADWLGDLRQSGALEEADLEELGSHLNDEMEQLMDKGLSEREAFWVATSRVGSREELSEEYAKANSRAVWRHRFLWMAVGAFAYFVLSGMIGLLSDMIAATTELSGFFPHSVNVFGLSSYWSIIAVLLVEVILASAAISAGYLVLTRDGFEIASRFRRMRRSRTGTVALCTTLVLLLTFLTVQPWLVNTLLASQIRPEQLGRISVASAVGTALFTILFAVALVSIAFVLSRPNKKSRLQASLGR
jgi:hypothetical protein